MNFEVGDRARVRYNGEACRILFTDGQSAHVEYLEDLREEEVAIVDLLPWAPETRSVEAINAEINGIFAKYDIKPGAGEEAFWNAVDQLDDDSDEIYDEDEDRAEAMRDDVERLYTLATEWERANKTLA